MEIRIAETTQLSEKEWASYVEHFNAVFKQHFDKDHFKHKYLTTIDGTSYHALLIENAEVVGCCSVIPHVYVFGTEKIKIGLAVDVFIHEDFRSDPYALYRMYKELCLYIKAQGLALVIAVPNDVAYPYWKNIVKWRDIGFIPYYAIPLRIANVLKSDKTILNFASRAFFVFLTYVSKVASWFWNPAEQNQPIRIDRSNAIVEKQRYTQEHHRVLEQDTFFSYRIVNEGDVVTAYLIDFYNVHRRKRDARSLHNAVHFIAQKNKIDIIVFVGKLTFPQFYLIKVPFSKEAKHLYFMADIIIPHELFKKEFICSYSNWDFGLFNYDVR